jgi:hypothetical protein
MLYFKNNVKGKCLMLRFLLKVYGKACGSSLAFKCSVKIDG